MIEKRPRLHVISGGGQARTSARGELLSVPRALAREEQLHLAGWRDGGAPGRLLSVGFDVLDFYGFHHVLASAGVRHVVDVRLLASFRGRGFAPDIVERTFRELGVTYFRCQDLANTYSSSSLNQHLSQRKYRQHLEENATDAIRRIADLLLMGTVLLLGRDARHFGADRELLVEFLARLHRPIELVVFSACQRAEIAASALTLNEIEVDGAPTKMKPRAPKKRGPKSIKEQLTLPGGSRNRDS